jgi:DNA-nicking Smr family endonuclease
MPVAPAARPSDTLRGGDRSIYFEAMNGVRRLDVARKERTGRVVASPPPKADAAGIQRDDEARARLRALVGGGARFDVREDDDYVEASAAGTPESVVRQLLRATPGPGLPSLDLHGAKEHEVEARVSRFVRSEHKKGAKRLLLIHGKGLHSSAEGPRGRSILGRATVAALTTGGAAPLVRAFVSAPTALGGTGALLVELTG